jgi:photosystem II stability/assembly factor-like uncharacterized protein
MRYILLSILAFFFILQIAYSENQGINTWTLNHSNNSRVFGMAIDPNDQSVMYQVGLDSGVYKTVNGGLSWFPVNNGITYKGAFCIAIAPSNSNVLYMGTDQNGASNSGLYISTNAGASWTLSNSGIVETSIGIQSIVVHPTNPAIAYMCVFDGLVASTNGVYKTTNYGATWVNSSNGLTNKNILTLLINPKNSNVLYAGSSFILPASTGPSNIFKSFDGGATWNNFSNGLPTNAATGDPIRAFSMSTLDTSVILAALFANDTAGGAYLTTNGGALWVKKSNGLVPLNTTGYLLRACSIRPGTNNQFFMGMDGITHGVWRSTNGGNSWNDFSSGALLNTYLVRALAFKTYPDTTLYAGLALTTIPGMGVYEYTWPTPLSGSWSEQSSGLTSLLLSVSAVNDDVAWVCGSSGKVIRTTNKGTDWIDVSGNIPTSLPLCNIFGWDANVAIVTGSTSTPPPGTGFIYTTTNGGINWTMANNSSRYGDYIWMTDANNAYFIGDMLENWTWDLLKSTNGGLNWSTWSILPTSNPLGSINNGACFFGTQVWFPSTGQNQIVYSSNMGANWTTQTITLSEIGIICFNNATDGLAGGSNGSPGMLKTTNSGLNWTTVTSPFPSSPISGICGKQSQYFSCSFWSSTIQYSSNFGANWTLSYTSPGGNFYHITKARYGNTIWAIRSNGGISYYGPIITGIKPVVSTVPTSYALEQNYPNPFNPVTKINFEIAKQGLVSLKVYNVVGREVITLVNEVKSPGIYSIDFDASELSSGVYFYKISAENYIETKKMMLVK